MHVYLNNQEILAIILVKIVHVKTLSLSFYVLGETRDLIRVRDNNII